MSDDSHVIITLRDVYDDVQELKQLVDTRLPERLDERLTRAEHKIAVLEAQQGPRVHWTAIVAAVAGIGALIVTLVLNLR